MMNFRQKIRANLTKDIVVVANGDKATVYSNKTGQFEIIELHSKYDGPVVLKVNELSKQDQNEVMKCIIQFRR